MQVEARATCKTSDRAVFKLSLTGTAAATAEVKCADCQIVSVDRKPSSDLAQEISGVFGVEGKLKNALQKTLDQACK